MKSDFDRVRQQVLEIIQNKQHQEVNRKTDMNRSGIYMLYVDCFEDDRVIPFYIGKTVNFQERYKEHLCEILSLNRLKHYCYEYALMKGLYNGAYKACKIFSYMVNHQCTLRDFHMIILEEIDDENERTKKEGEYINELLAPFLGFNQMDTISRHADYRYGNCTEAEYMELVSSDIKRLQKFVDYGYNRLNWYLTCSSFNEEQVTTLLSVENAKVYAEILNKKNHLSEMKLKKIEATRYIDFDCISEVQSICSEDVGEYFSKYNLKSEDKKKRVYYVLLNGSEKLRAELDKYFDQYIKEKAPNLIDLLNEKYSDSFEAIKKEIQANLEIEKTYESQQTEFYQSILSQLLIGKEYKSHPLESLYERYQFPETVGSDNICYINIEYTCFKSDYYGEHGPEICKIDYCIFKDGKVYKREAFINNGLAEYWGNDDIYYWESGFSKGPFHIAIRGDVHTYIPVSMEYKNGINEFVLKNVEMENKIPVFKEIDALVDKKTKIVYTTSGYKGTIKRYADLADEIDIPFLKRLIRMAK